MRKCRKRSCMCRTCIKNCIDFQCGCHKCKGKKRSCRKYKKYEQLRIFSDAPRKTYHKAPRESWDYYGISKDRYKKLRTYIQSEKYADLARSAAQIAAPDIAEYILLSVMKKYSYENIEYSDKLGRIPCGRTDFYGYRRYFYSIFDKEIRRIGNERK